MFGKAIWDKLRYCIFENHEGDLSQKSPKPWLLVNHTKLTNSCIEVIIFSQGAITNQRMGNYKTAGNYKITPLTVQCRLPSIV